MHVPRTSKYGSRVQLATYLFGLRRYLIKKSDRNDKLLSTEATFGFSYKVALYLSYLHIKFCDKIER